MITSSCTAWSNCSLGTAPARHLCLSRPHLVALGASVLPGGERLGHWAPSHRLWPCRLQFELVSKQEELSKEARRARPEHINVKLIKNQNGEFPSYCETNNFPLEQEFILSPRVVVWPEYRIDHEHLTLTLALTLTLTPALTSTLTLTLTLALTRIDHTQQDHEPSCWQWLGMKVTKHTPPSMARQASAPNRRDA